MNSTQNIILVAIIFGYAFLELASHRYKNFHATPDDTKIEAGMFLLLIALTQSAQAHDKAFMDAKVTTARFYADHLLSRAPGLRDSIVDGAKCVTELALEAF